MRDESGYEKMVRLSYLSPIVMNLPLSSKILLSEGRSAIFQHFSKLESPSESPQFNTVFENLLSFRPFIALLVQRIYCY